MPRLSALLALLALVAASPACKEKKAAPVQEEAPPLVGSAPAAPLALLADEAPVPRLGLPRGCTFDGKVQAFKLPAPDTIFFAADGHPGELVVASPGDPWHVGVDHAGDPSPGLPFAHFDPESPPLFAAAPAGWLSLYGRPGTGSTGRAVLTRPGATPELLAEGDGLAPADLRCDGPRCVALTSRVGRVAGAGASIFLGDAGAAAGAWRRVDTQDEDGERDHPYVVAAVRGEAAWVTTADERGVRFFTLQGREAKAGPRLAARWGALDAIELARPVLFAHGSRPADDCQGARPAIVIEREGFPPVRVPTDAPALSLFVRPLDHGALAAWLQPVHCGDQRRRVVYAMLIDDDGTPTTSPMAVGDATGLALRTTGPQTELFLLDHGRIVWARATCSLGAAR